MNEKIKVIEGGVTAAKGFMAASTAAGIKYKNRQDMAMIYSKEPCKSAGTFTTNLVKAAPVKWDKNQVTSGAIAFTPAAILSIGSCIPMTPVEATKTPFSATPKVSAAAFAVCAQ